MPVSIVVDDRAFRAYLEGVEQRLDRLINEAAEELSQEASSQARSASSRLGARWETSQGALGEMHVEAPEFFAHFLAGGTGDHGPSGSTFLAFEVAGGMVFARHVRGISADPFDERAVRSTESKLPSMLDRLIAIGG